jgi:hypothetical protein
VASYGLTLLLPFDSFRVVLEPGQWGVLALHYLALATPFLCTGTAVGFLLAARPERMGRTYAANLTGSAAGCLLSVALPALVGAEGVILLCATLATAAGACFVLPRVRRRVALLVPHAAIAGLLVLVALRTPVWLEVPVSPYKGLSYALQYPDARRVFRGWNSFSRVDVVEASEIRSLPGQGFACLQAPPPQRGLFVDGDNLNAITRVEDPADLGSLTGCLLTALPHRLRPGGRVLVLNSRGGFDLLVALAEGARTVAAVEPNPLVVQAVREQGAWAGNVYGHPQVTLFEEEGRAFLARPGPRYDVILLPAPGAYHPVTSGAYSLAEDYAATVEGFAAALERLSDDGVLALVRWLQVPPSESLRAFALAVAAVERVGGDPAQSLVVLRSYNQALILARRGAFTAQEVDDVRAFASARAFDLVYAPGIRADEVNRYNVLPEPDYYRAFTGLLETGDRGAWLSAYPFDVAPPTDDRPFFGHFFRWRQAREVLTMAGHVWQPFGGAGYLVLLALLAVATVSATTLVLLPLAGLRATRSVPRRVGAFRALVPFGLLGLAFLFVEIPLLQRFILFLGHPTYAMATVLGALLLFSGVGSLLSGRVRLGAAIGGLVALVIAYQVALPLLTGLLLRLSLPVRILMTVAALAPLGTLMGVPFPSLLSALERKTPGLVPWAWGINGALSVVASVLAALTALTWGFGSVLGLGVLCYLGVWLTTVRATRSRRGAGARPVPGQ